MSVDAPGSAERAAVIADAAVCWLGRVVAWLALAMVIVTGAVVLLRYVFDTGWIWLQEAVTWMHAAVFLLAAGYTLARDEHVRVDIFYRRMSPRRQAIVDTAGVLLLLLPTCGWIAYSAWDYVVSSWQVTESSLETGGMPGLYLLKTLIIVTPALLVLEGLALVVLRWARLGASERGPATGL